jgi:hypothetical protein
VVVSLGLGEAGIQPFLLPRWRVIVWPDEDWRCLVLAAAYAMQHVSTRRYLLGHGIPGQLGFDSRSISLFLRV